MPAVLTLDEGWEAGRVTPGAEGPSTWLPARVPGTVAAVLQDAGAWRPGDVRDLDAEEWWFRTRFTSAPAAPGEDVRLALDGIATIAEVVLNGTPVLASESMFARHAVDAGALLVDGENELVVRCLPLAERLGGRRRPRARWRTRVADNALRWYRTSLLGRAPGFAPGPAPVGPYRPIRIERRTRFVLEELALRPRVEADGTGVLAVRLRTRGLSGAVTGAEVTLGDARVMLAPEGDALAGELRVPGVERWWPHTHGTPVLHDVTVAVLQDDGLEPLRIARRVGFRTVADGGDDGLALVINDVPVFARGAVWTPADPVGLAGDARPALTLLRDAGCNLVRVPGLGAYEDAAFHDLCDELGLLVWQDFAFANFDYPVADEDFRATVAAEAAQVLGDLAGRPSLVVLCGNSEVEQQVAMLGLDPALGRGELFGELLPAAIAASGADAVWIPSAPSGGRLPFQPSAGVANYFGVGGYRRGLEDARRAEVRFASECLAFANVPDEAAVAAVLPDVPGDVVVHHPRWKAGTPRDAGSGWDFEDVRDHYLRTLFGVDPVALRSVDHERYLELSRAVSGEVMAEVLGEWRRAASPCAGGIVLWLRDLVPGPGWGLLDHRGVPKLALHHLRRVLAPVAVWTTDEGMNGIDIHAANDGPAPLDAQLAVTLVRDGEHVVDRAVEDVTLAAHGSLVRSVEGMLGRFVDASYAYRFGPPAHHAVAVTLHAGGELLAQDVRFPAGRPLTPEPADRLGLELSVRPADDGTVAVTVAARRLAYGVRLHAGDWEATDGGLTVLPGTERTIVARPPHAEAAWEGASVTALNLEGRVRTP